MADVPSAPCLSSVVSSSMRAYRLNTPLLALCLAIFSEVASFGCFFLFGKWGAFGPANLVSAMFGYFHTFGDSVSSWVVPHQVTTPAKIGAFLIFFGVGLLQWWVLFFAVLLLMRQRASRVELTNR